MMDKAKAFQIKIASKNQLRQLLKQKKKAFETLKEHPEMDFTKKQLQDEITAIELEIKSYD